MQRMAQHLHGLGPRAVYEFIAELARAHGDDVVRRLEGYHKLDPAVLRALGGDRFPPVPIHLVINGG